MSWPTVERSGVLFTQIAPSEYRWWDMPAVYLFERQTILGGDTLLYVGQTASAANRLGPPHEHWLEAQKQGMNAVLLHTATKTKPDRLRLETQLRAIYNPPLNRQGSPIGDALAALYPTMAQPKGAFGEQLKGLGVGLLGAFDNPPRRR